MYTLTLKLQHSYLKKKKVYLNQIQEHNNHRKHRTHIGNQLLETTTTTQVIEIISCYAKTTKLHPETKKLVYWAKKQNTTKAI